MATLNVSNASQLTAALNNANGGDTIRLAAGNYGALDLNGIQNNNLRYSSDVTITSADANNEAVFSSASIRYVTNLKFDNVDFSMVNSGANNSLVWIDNSSGITVTNATLDGYRVGGIQNGFRASNSSDVELSNSELTDFYYGAAVSRTDGLRITGNNVHGMDFDGMRFAQVQNVQITGNYLHDMHGVVNGGHRDMIQFWTEGTTAASENVNISNNKIEVGTGKMIQSIFVWNEQGNANLYKNFTIANNYIEGNHPHGITVGEANGVSISGNTVIEANSPYYQKYWEPRINVDDGAFNVRITGNTAHSIPDSEPGWIVSGNRIVAVGYGWDGSAEPSTRARPRPARPPRARRAPRAAARGRAATTRSSARAVRTGCTAMPATTPCAAMRGQTICPAAPATTSSTSTSPRIRPACSATSCAAPTGPRPSRARAPQGATGSIFRESMPTISRPATRASPSEAPAPGRSRSSNSATRARSSAPTPTATRPSSSN